MAPRQDLMELFSNLDAAIDAWAFHILLTDGGDRIDAGMVRHFRTQARLDLLNELAIQRSLDAVGPVTNRPARRKPAQVRPAAEPPH